MDAPASSSPRPIRVLFALPGLHRINRGAEVAFESVAQELSRAGGFEVTLIGSGKPREDRGYRFLRSGCLASERFRSWPRLPAFRTEAHYEEFTFAAGFLRRFRPERYDIAVTCSYPFLNWVLQARRAAGGAPLHVFVTQNGDWPMHRSNSEFRLFRCDAAVFTNPDYQETHDGKWPARLIPNGVDCRRFGPGPSERKRLGLPPDVPLVLMVSALIPSKRVPDGIRAVSRLPNVHLAVAGDGPLRAEVDRTGAELMPGRFHRLSLPQSAMPALYRSANLFLHMSMEEPYGIVYLEALASGLPVVAHDRRVSRWILEDHGVYVDTRDLGAVASAVETCLDRTGDRAAALEFVRSRYDWSRIALTYGSFFRELVGNGRR